MTKKSAVQIHFDMASVPRNRVLNPLLKYLGRNWPEKTGLAHEGVLAEQRPAAVSLSFSYNKLFKIWEKFPEVPTEVGRFIFDLFFLGNCVIVEGFHRHVR